MELFDSMHKRKHKFVPLDDKVSAVKIYTCGPSVYAYSHIGNFRTYLFEDILVRYLIYKGYKVVRVMNITDIEDKAIDQAKKEKKGLQAVQKDKIKRFLSEFSQLGMLKPTKIAIASEHIPQMIKLIEKLDKKGYCKKEKDGIYFDVKKFARYGKLGRIKKKYLGKIAKDDYSKEGFGDFRLWKFWSPGDGKIGWESEFGRGRPGWHIECSAMAMHYLGESMDIHCGGSDNIYPHHENEIAQSEAATGKKFANVWLHAKHLTIGKKKMSKRTGNVLYVSQLKKAGVPPKCLRFYLTCERYRSKLDFTIDKFKGKICECEKVRKLITRLGKIKAKGDGVVGARIGKTLIASFTSAMDDDLNTKLAYKRIFRILGSVELKKLTKEDAEQILGAIGRIDSVLRVF